MTRSCWSCGGTIPPSARADARFCSDRCRQSAYRRRMAGAEIRCRWCAGVLRRRPAGRSWIHVASDANHCHDLLGHSRRAEPAPTTCPDCGKLIGPGWTSHRHGMPGPR